ncbi:DNA double-strand break repair nuclease NurA [Synechococcus sp. PCC 6312]|uniref:DNA double-strand break repair nuclease NurA n=1 Tax=Synechococcus sp. (strain ATCC 27167 / PCC 6312) TaxID=195253 RepID=UPI00029F20E8|nr:DNA double-strand break repair nuclease NurA [Synechococcus sp. PCC 6312]AFY59437.1 NurA domain-containing protein [Synechococcus sp. PCC 6312]
MPLNLLQLRHALSQNRADFHHFDHGFTETYQAYERAFQEISHLSHAELILRLPPEQWIGARPLEKVTPAWAVDFPYQWQHRDQSRAWAKTCLQGMTTVAVDGSQLLPSEDISIPVGLVQVAWFANPHLAGLEYEKNTKLEILTPLKLQSDPHHRPPDRLVNLRRFQMETEQLIKDMKNHAQARDRLLFFDGSLIATFAETFDPTSRQDYVQALINLITASETYQVPLIAYIDHSRARDLCSLLTYLADLPATDTVFDSHLLSGLAWGQRTPVFQAQRVGSDGRPGILSDYGDVAEKVAFCYLKAHSGQPVRLEFPSWLVESGQIETIMDWVRAEIIAGQGYPYAIETADQAAVIQATDRQAFLKIFQAWATEQNLNLRFARKYVSKAQRR